MKILVVDLETTGFWPSDVIVEIGICLVDTEAKTIELVFDKVVKEDKFNEKKHKNSWIFKNTDLTVEDVVNARPLSDYKDKIQGLFDKYKMTAYNKSFDIRFLKKAGFVMDDVKCLMKTATKYSEYKDKNGNVKKPSVEEIYTQFFMKDGETYIEEHRAGADAIDESKILLRLVELKNGGVLIKNDPKPKKISSFFGD
jgi:DNA polymerase III epsilon subunit-like protein